MFYMFGVISGIYCCFRVTHHRPFALPKPIPGSTWLNHLFHTFSAKHPLYVCIHPLHVYAHLYVCVPLHTCPIPPKGGIRIDTVRCLLIRAALRYLRYLPLFSREEHPVRISSPNGVNECLLFSFRVSPAKSCLHRCHSLSLCGSLFHVNPGGSTVICFRICHSITK